ncbi:uncharacterized protein LOC113780597 [Coffea eugenioides]|uniref:uncharacterized protein LOC113780597 n=1 Tax=Coffea eugenioides TaxID=49369 RepID=UPI000F6155DA|nr:uncharacterized protein LOC113780597 [Coffea eugenioides]
MDGDSAAGPDGFTGKFFSSSWDIIGMDIYRAVQSFFSGEELPRRIISIILVARLAPILPKIISANQSGFVRGRLISDNYLLTQELISNIGRKARGGNVALKLDMMKAYDRVVWPFLINVLRAFGFGEQWIDMGFCIPRGCPLVTHLGYADDVLIFSSVSARSLKLVKRVLTTYEAVFGQMINAGKSCFLLHPKVCPSKKMAIQRLTGFMYKSFPIKYLGFPLYCGRRKKDYFGGLCQAILLRLQSWQNRVLSQEGKIVLLKHVLSSMPTYLLMAASPPKSIFQELKGMFSNFLWGATEGGSKYHWIRWKDLCVPHEKGGVGLRQLEDVFKPFSIKLWWNFRANTSLWLGFMQAKFCREVHPNLVFGAKGSEVWRRMMKVQNIAERHIRWIVRSGSSNFWFDNWLGSRGLSDRLDSLSDHKVVDFVQHST